jgi:hypothetical protein
MANLPPVSTIPAANLPSVSTTLVAPVSTIPAADMPPVSERHQISVPAFLLTHWLLETGTSFLKKVTILGGFSQ